MKMPEEASSSTPNPEHSNGSTVAAPRALVARPRGELAADTLPDPERLRETLAGKAAPAQIEQLAWLVAYGRERGIPSLGKLAPLIRAHPSTLSKIYSGKYPAPLDGIVADIESFRGGASAGRVLSGQPVAPTRVRRRVAELCDLARANHTMGILWGPLGSGKTVSLEWYAAQPRPERTFLVTMPAGGGTRRFMRELATVCGISPNKGHDELCELFMRFFDRDSLLIVDEMHETMIGRSIRTTTVELVREIHDRCKCGVVMCGTDVLHDMFASAKWVKFLGQTASRALKTRIPPQPRKGDILAICHALGFPDLKAGAVRNEVERVAGEQSLRGLVVHLRLALRRAAKQQRPVVWEDFSVAVATMQARELGEEADADRWEMEGGEE